MSRLIGILLVNVLAYLMLRRLWPAAVRGWRLKVGLGLMLLSMVAWVLPIALGVGAHGRVPVVGVPLKLFSSGWTIAAFIVVLFGLPLVLARWWRGRRKPPLEAANAGVDLERRSLLVSAGRAVPLVAMGTSSLGMVNGSVGFTVQKVEVPIRNLPAALDGFRIGQITDVHVGTFIGTDYVRAAVQAMNDAKVHLQVMTGDLIDDLDQLEGTMTALEGNKAQHGMMAVMGNHEYWRGADPIFQSYAAIEKRGGPVKLLVDQSHVLEHAGHRIRVVGVDYPMGRGPGVKTKRFQRSAETAFQGVAADEFVLCLSHHPSFFPFAAEKGAHLTLAGHTHGGQVALLGMPLFWFAFEFMLGRYKQKDSHLYVSGGTGHWLPFRLGVPPEVTILTLRAA
ncbi:MAG TPA: metallophosphoesterase [Myxococcaceae bacterium]